MPCSCERRRKEEEKKKKKRRVKEVKGDVVTLLLYYAKLINPIQKHREELREEESFLPFFFILLPRYGCCQ